MKRKTVFRYLIFILLIFLSKICYSADIVFSWEYDANNIIDGFFLFERDQNQAYYDYNAPVSTLIDPNSRIHIQENVTEGLRYWILMAKQGEEYSVPSNEVSAVIPLVTPSNLQINSLKSGDIADVLFYDGKVLNNMTIISYDYEKNLWQIRRSGITAKDFFIPACSIKAIVRQNPK